MQTSLRQRSGEQPTPDLDPSDGGREFTQEPSQENPQPTVATVLTKLQKWGDYAAYGEVVKHTKFIPMKTPLSEEILESWSLPEAPRHRLTVRALLSDQTQKGREIGMMLDLSNHDCLYEQDIPAGLHYEHIKLVAKELPPPSFVTAVRHAANSFWKANPHLYIAIHCAYGFNRTGFVVCCYLIEQYGLTVDQALDAFRESRPPGVKHQEFRAELRARYEPQGPPEPKSGPAPAPAPISTSTPAPAGADTEVDSEPVLSTPGLRLSRTPSDMFRQQQQRKAADALTRWYSGDMDGGGPGDPAGGLGDSSEWLDGSRSNSQTTGALVDSTPNGLVRQPTPMSENDSLGANDRVILQGLRNQQAPNSGGRPMTPSHLETLLAAAIDKTPNARGTGLPRAPIIPALQRKSVGDVVWTVDDDAGPLDAALATPPGSATTAATASCRTVTAVSSQGVGQMFATMEVNRHSPPITPPMQQQEMQDPASATQDAQQVVDELVSRLRF